MTLTGSATRVRRPDIQSNKHHNAKHNFPGFTIQFLDQYSLTNSTGGQEILPPQDYQG